MDPCGFIMDVEIVMLICSWWFNWDFVNYRSLLVFWFNGKCMSCRSHVLFIEWEFCVIKITRGIE